MNTRQIKQQYQIKAPLHKVWQALTDADIAEQWGAGPAIFEAREGGKFSYWDGDIHGTNTKIMPEKLLEQDWYGHDNPTWKYNVRFTFEKHEDTTIVDFLYSGNIIDEQRDIKDWQTYYFDPIKKLLDNK